MPVDLQGFRLTHHDGTGTRYFVYKSLATRAIGKLTPGHNEYSRGQIKRPHPLV